MFFLKRPERKKLLYLFWFSVLLSTLDLRVTIPTPTDSILFVVDVTMSMNSKDMSLDEQGEVSRVFFAKDTLKNSIKALQCGTEVGLGIFAGYQATILFQPIEVNIPQISVVLRKHTKILFKIDPHKSMR